MGNIGRQLAVVSLLKVYSYTTNIDATVFQRCCMHAEIAVPALKWVRRMFEFPSENFETVVHCTQSKVYFSVSKQRKNSLCCRGRITKCLYYLVLSSPYMSVISLPESNRDKYYFNV